MRYKRMIKTIIANITVIVMFLSCIPFDIIAEEFSCEVTGEHIYENGFCRDCNKEVPEFNYENVITWLLLQTENESSKVYEYFKRNKNNSLNSTGKNYGYFVNKDLCKFFDIDEEKIDFTWRIEKNSDKYKIFFSEYEVWNMDDGELVEAVCYNNGEYTDIYMNVGRDTEKNKVLLKHEHNYVENECECGEKNIVECNHKIIYHNLEEEGHKRICSICDYEEELEKHEYENLVCKYCGYEIQTNFNISGIMINGIDTVKDDNTFANKPLPYNTKNVDAEFYFENFSQMSDFSLVINDVDNKVNDDRLNTKINDLINGKNIFNILLLKNGEIIEEYKLFIYVKSSSGTNSENIEDNADMPAAQELAILSTDSGSVAQIEKNDKGKIEIKREYAEEIITKANGLNNFTASTINSPNIDEIILKGDLIRKLEENSNITEIGIDNIEASLRIKLSDIINKGDISFNIERKDNLYKIAVISSLYGNITKFNKNIEITIPYEINKENEKAITMFLKNENGSLKNLKGTYNKGTVYCLTKDISGVIYAEENMFLKGNEDIPEWAYDFIVSMTSKEIINNIKSNNITKNEFMKILNSILEKTNTSDSENKFIKREEVAIIIEDKLKNYNCNLEYGKKYIDEEEINNINAVDFVTDAGIMTGYEDDSFRPQNILTEYEASIIYDKVFNIINVF